MESIFDKVGKKTPFNVPDNFFNDMEERIKDRTVRKKSPKLSFSMRWRAAAAAVAFLAIGFASFALLEGRTQGGGLAMADSLGSAQQLQTAQLSEQDDDETGDEVFLSDEELEMRIAFYDSDVFMDYDY